MVTECWCAGQLEKWGLLREEETPCRAAVPRHDNVSIKIPALTDGAELNDMHLHSGSS